MLKILEDVVVASMEELNMVAVVTVGCMVAGIVLI